MNDKKKITIDHHADAMMLVSALHFAVMRNFPVEKYLERAEEVMKEYQKREMQFDHEQETEAKGEEATIPVFKARAMPGANAIT